MDEYLDVKDVMRIFKLARDTIYDKTNPNKTPKEHMIPCYKPTGKLLFKRSEVERWVDSHKVKAS